MDANDQQTASTDPDFVALGLGGANMMAMLWTVAMGRRATGVEMRGDPFLGVHWNIREDFYHQLGLIDQMMLERYGEDRLPRRADGGVFRLAECFYSPRTASGDIVADEIIDGFDADQHIAGTIHHIEFIDDRWRDGAPNRVITRVDPPPPPERPDPRKIRTSMVDVLDGPSVFQAEAASIQKLLRRYLERLEQPDVQRGLPPRVRLYTHHRVVPTANDGFIPSRDGRMRIRIEALRELDYRGEFIRMREPGSQVIDLGIPELFVIAEGFSSSDAKRLGFEQQDVRVDHGDGRGPVVAQADFLAGLLDVLVGGRLRRRICSEFDPHGNEYWVRQIAVGHENDPEVGWVVVQVPDFKVFDPIEAGLVPAETHPDSPEYFAAYKAMVYDYYIEQCAEILEIPKHDLMQVQMIYGPTLFSLVERVGADALIAANGVVAGDSFGNGHFLTSGGAMTGIIGHSARVLEYWRARDAGAAPVVALHRLADRIREDTHAWLQVSAKEYSQAVPINFGAERIERISKASGIDPQVRAHAIDAARRQRHALIPLDPSNWRRLVVRNGKVLSTLPELAAAHPLQRTMPSGPRAVSAAPLAPMLGRGGPRRGAAQNPSTGSRMPQPGRTLMPSGTGRGAGSKRSIAILSLAAFVLNALAVALFAPQFSGQPIDFQRVLYAPTSLNPTSLIGGSTHVGAAMLLSLGGALALLAGVLLAFVRTAQIRRWGWLVAVLLLGPLGSLLYSVVGPGERRERTEPRRKADATRPDPRGAGANAAISPRHSSDAIGLGLAAVYLPPSLAIPS